MSATTEHPALQKWISIWLSGRPHQVIGSEDDPYLLRWYIIPRNPVLNVYLHKFLRDDDERGLHDHPWWFITAILRGGYIEHTENQDRQMILRCRTSIFDVRSPFWRRSVGYRRATWQHRVALPHGFNSNGRADSTLSRVPCWTLIITGRKVRNWGFWCPDYTGPFNRRVGEHFVPW